MNQERQVWRPESRHASTAERRLWLLVGVLVVLVGVFGFVGIRNIGDSSTATNQLPATEPSSSVSLTSVPENNVTTVPLADYVNVETFDYALDVLAVVKDATSSVDALYLSMLPGFSGILTEVVGGMGVWGSLSRFRALVPPGCLQEFHSSLAAHLDRIEVESRNWVPSGGSGYPQAELSQQTISAIEGLQNFTQQLTQWAFPECFVKF